jgi:putative PIN family toxin of toxin-antitoxin system
VKLVLDTNIVLDLFVFRDAAVAGLRGSLAAGDVEWLATPAMREELACVLAYGNIAARMDAAETSPEAVLDAFDAHARMVDAPTRSVITCRDADDQKFIDLAVANGARLLSKDKAVLALRRKLAAAAVEVSARP